MPKVDVWFIAGARRWAKVVVAELCAAIPEECVIYLQDDPAEVELRQWLKSSGLGKRIQVVERPIPCPPGKTGVALIVNSAYRHRSSIEEALSSGYNVVSEKPMSFSKAETLDLIDQAKVRRLALFCTNTYLFADYLAVFRHNWLTGRKVDAVHIEWTDATNEVRYGETKGYDSSVPIIFDVLPHIANIMLATLGDCAPMPVGISVHRGGSEVVIHYRHESIDIHVRIARNASQRSRRLKFSGSGSEIILDFTAEPGVVVIDEAPPASTDSDWRQKPKPIAAMLASVVEFFATGKQDARLSPLAGALGNALIDGVSESYVDQQLAFLATNGGRNTPVPNEYFCYADKEVHSINARALPYIAPDSPLQKFAYATHPRATSQIAH